ncbi:MAG: helix-turn-helix transcriptional regulator [Planctomycetes bacterium]|nr:helix-turn-helix transcriptional regulator [Planctomycetota bacterium]
MARVPARVREALPAPADASDPVSADPSSESPAGDALPAAAAGVVRSPHDRWRPDVQSSVAINLRRARMERHFSLDDLADRCGISRSMLSQIENQRSIPSVTVLYRISEGLGVPFAGLLEPQTERKLVVTKLEDSRTLATHDEHFQTRTLFPFDDPLRPLEFYEVTLLPGGHHASEPHPVGTCEYLVLVSGIFRLKVGNRQVELRPRDSVFLQADIEHEYVNPGRENAVLYMVVTRPERSGGITGG